jgi:hypothetical protein
MKNLPNVSTRTGHGPSFKFWQERCCISENFAKVFCVQNFIEITTSYVVRENSLSGFCEHVINSAHANCHRLSLSVITC